MIVHCGVDRTSQQDGIIRDNNDGIIVDRAIHTLNTHQFVVDKNQVCVYQNENAINYEITVGENAISYSYVLKGVIGSETDMDNHDDDDDDCDDDDINNPGPFDNNLRNRFRPFVDADYLRNTLAF